jgi:hypothetical protein
MKTKEKKKSSHKTKANPSKKNKNKKIKFHNGRIKEISKSQSPKISNSEIRNTNVNILVNNEQYHNKIIYKRKVPKNSNKNCDKIIKKYTDFEMNSFSYKDALKLDKRTCSQYYFSLIRAKIPFLFAFYCTDDFNLTMIKICLSFLFFVIYFSFNTLFFTDNTIHQIYKDGGKYNFPYFFPKILYSFFICYIIMMTVKRFSLSEGNLLEIVKENNKNKINSKIQVVKRCLIIKYFVFFGTSLVFLMIFWYYLSAFCAVYKNTQIYIIINTIISFLISVFYIILFNILPCIFRIKSLKKGSKNEKFYKSSKILQEL